MTAADSVSSLRGRMSHLLIVSAMEWLRYVGPEAKFLVTHNVVHLDPIWETAQLGISINPTSRMVLG